MYRGESITADDSDGLGNFVRNPFSVDKITYNEQTGTTIYRSKHNHNTKHFIGAMTHHIPEKCVDNISYHAATFARHVFKRA